MSGSFGSLNTALSALRYQQVALDVASTNIANSGTEGYVRRRVVGQTMGAGVVPALWSRSNEVGNGVTASRVDRMVDPFLDMRSRTEHGQQAYLDLKSAALGRVETGLAEPGDAGVAAALGRFRTSLQDLVNAPGGDGGEAARNQVLAAAATVADAIRLQAHHVDNEAVDQRAKLLVTVDEANVVAGDLAATNRSIASAQGSGTDAATLLDARDRLALRLSELTGATASVRADGGLDMAVNGVPLVTGQVAAQLRITSGVTPGGAPDGAPVTFSVAAIGAPVGTPVPGALGGETGAVADLLDSDLPAYTAGLDAIARDFADALNTQHALGFDAAGAPGDPLFAYDPTDPAGSLTLAVTDPAKLAASALPGGVLDATNAERLGSAITVEGAYQRLVTGFGSSVASVQRLAANQKTLTTQIDSAREQLAGVNLDEETVNMLAAQHAYEAAARVMTTLDSVLDTLINRTGVR